MTPGLPPARAVDPVGKALIDDVDVRPDPPVQPTQDPPTPEDVAARAFGPPPDATPLSPKNLWIRRGDSTVFADGYVAMREGPLEMFACGAGTKEHESVVGVIPRASDVHAALLAAGASRGTPVRFLPKFVPPTGQRIRVWVAWRDPRGAFRVVDGRQWIRREDGGPMDVDWVFAGSSVWTDERTGESHYQADGGDMICVSNFSTSMLDVPIDSSAEAGALIFQPRTDAIPPRGTPVRVLLRPIPMTPDGDQMDPPTEAEVFTSS